MDKNIKDKLILEHIQSVSKIAKKYAEKTGINIHELESYGYEGLLVGIDKIDISPKKYIINSKLHQYIERYIIRGIKEMQPHYLINYNNAFLKVKEEVEKREYTTLEEDITLLREISNILVERGIISKDRQEDYEQQYLLNHPESLLQCKDSLICQEEAIFSSVFKMSKEDIQKEVDEFLSKTYNIEKYIITKWFGIGDNEAKTLSAIVQERHLDYPRGRQILNKGLKRIKNSEDLKRVRKLLTIINEEANYVDYIDSSKPKLSELPKEYKRKA